MFFWKRFKSEPKIQSKGTALHPSLAANLQRFKEDIFANDDTINYREFKTRGPQSRACLLVYAENMAKRETLSDYLVRPLIQCALPVRLKDRAIIDYLASSVIQNDQVQIQSDYQELAQSILSGRGVLIVDGCTVGIVVMAEGWPKRTVSEPISESVVRGPRQAFVEELGENIGLIRRKIKNSKLKAQYLQIGVQTYTSMAIMYIEGIAAPSLVEEVFKRLETIHLDGVLDSGYIEDFIQDSPNCPLPTIGSTERPDIVAARLLEGRVAILVDGTPFVLTVPSLFLEAFQANEDYYKNWLVASFDRFLRYLCFFLTIATPALYVSLINYHPQLLPTELILSISSARTNVPFPALVEAVAMLLLFEVLREGGVRLPQPVGQAISIVGAVVLGDAAVSANLVSAPMIIVVGVTGVASFVVPRLQDPAILIRFIFLFLASILGLYGVVFAFIGFFLQLASMESFGVPYLSSLTSFSAGDLKDTVVRVPWWLMRRRPKFLAPKNRVRLRGNRS
ncbi:MAG: spore germination protein [Firmicutes bacterium]|nr:spore germination protein [Bacillota bacterium]